MDQMNEWRPDALASFARLSDYKSVEFLGETYYHSLAALYDWDEFHRQRQLHQSTLRKYLNREASVFRNTELIYSNEIAQAIAPFYQGILGEGVDWYMEGHHPNHVFRVPKGKGLGLLLRNHRVSDEISFRFPEIGLNADEFLDRIEALPGEIINLFLDYETFGEHIKADIGILDFLEEIFKKAVERKIKFRKPTKAIEKAASPEKLSIPSLTSWADTERDTSAWRGNEMQRLALKKVYELGPSVRKNNTPMVWEQWGRLQTSDHYYYMSTKGKADGEVHEYFNPFNTPYDAYIHFMNVLSDFELRIKGHTTEV